PAHGRLSGAAPALTDTPAANYKGADGFMLKANEGRLDPNVATVSITVAAVNDAPVAADQAVTTDVDTAKAITLGATDTEGAALRSEERRVGKEGRPSGAAPQQTHTPAANYNGADGCTLKANDG